MSISKDLLLAILSMDAYNQGYGEGIEHGETLIGSASLSTDSQEVFRDPDAAPGALNPAQTAGFYAAAYDTPYGVVISYRGT